MRNPTSAAVEFRYRFDPERIPYVAKSVSVTKGSFTLVPVRCVPASHGAARAAPRVAASGMKEP